MPAPRLTGKRLADYENAKQLYAQRLISRPDYSAILRTLEKREAKAQKAKARRVARAVAPAVVEQQGIQWEDLREWVEARFPRTFGAPDIAFTLTLRSGVIAGVSRDFRFKSLYHFQAFMDAIDRAETKNDSANYRTMADVLGSNESVFEVVIPTVSEISAGCNHHKEAYLTCDTPYYTLHLYNPLGDGQNCGFKIVERLTNTSISYSSWRKVWRIEPNTPLTTQQVAQVYRANLPAGAYAKHLVFIDDTFNETINKDKYEYVFVRNGHYYLVQKADYRGMKDKKTKRGMLYWDIETRPTGMSVPVGKTRSYILGDALLCIYYQRFGSSDYSQKSFVTEVGGKSSCRQFLDWLSVEASEGHFYHCIAHNGSRFDLYFLLPALTEQEQLLTETQLRGYAIIGLQFKSHLFKDSCCFLTDSLDNLCKSYKVTDGKITEFEYKGQTLSNKNICFYKPELYMKDFLRLRDEEPEFWAMYEKYCMRDCIGLAQVWSTFKREYDGLIETMFKYTPQLKAKVALMGTNTIGSLSRKILEATTYEAGPGKRLKRSVAYTKYVRFLQYRTEKKVAPQKRDSDDDSADEEPATKVLYVLDPEKIAFMNNFKRGGISHSNQPGKHTHSLISYDIASQYPASMMYMTIPAGESRWVENYSPLYNGFYQLADLEFDTDYAFKPVAGKNEDGVLQWATDEIDSVYLDSYMIKYLKAHYGLKSFTVVKGLVGSCVVKGQELFGKYVETLYGEKKRQDALKTAGNKEYNPALRECIKLFLNSLSGKLVEDPSRYFKLEYAIAPDSKAIDGVEAVKNTDDTKYNEWITAGVMVYSYSKRLLFEYVRCLPDNSNDVIHIETDSIYFNKKHNDTFVENVKAYKGKEYPVKIGSDLGNVKVEKDTDATSYFLGKKFYCIGDLYKIKGIPLKTIDEYGNDVKLVTTELYETIYNGETVKKEFYTMKKVLFGDSTYISSHKMSRTISPNSNYVLYE